MRKNRAQEAESLARDLLRVMKTPTSGRGLSAEARKQLTAILVFIVGHYQDLLFWKHTQARAEPSFVDPRDELIPKVAVVAMEAYKYLRLRSHGDEDQNNSSMSNTGG